jgi:hypothetical protein
MSTRGQGCKQLRPLTSTTAVLVVLLVAQLLLLSRRLDSKTRTLLDVQVVARMISIYRAVNQAWCLQYIFDEYLSSAFETVLERYIGPKNVTQRFFIWGHSERRPDHGEGVVTATALHETERYLEHTCDSQQLHSLYTTHKRASIAIFLAQRQQEIFICRY